MDLTLAPIWPSGPAPFLLTHSISPESLLCYPEFVSVYEPIDTGVFSRSLEQLPVQCQQSIGVMKGIILPAQGIQVENSNLLKPFAMYLSLL